MEDKRVIKTKKNLKATLVALITKMPFEKISVTEICKAGETSRITFYTYYEDKYALAEDLFLDLMKEADEDYHNLQNQNNPENDAIQGYTNLLECILNLYYNNYNFFSHATAKENPYLYTTFFRCCLESVDSYIRRHTRIRAKYGPKMTSALICNGLISAIIESGTSGISQEELRRNLKGMYKDILKSDLFLSI